MTTQATYYIIRALVALVAIPFHEAGHALAAWLLGDATAKREGRLSLNPFAHFDLLGTLCMVFAGVVSWGHRGANMYPQGFILFYYNHFFPV